MRLYDATPDRKKTFAGGVETSGDSGVKCLNFMMPFLNFDSRAREIRSRTDAAVSRAIGSAGIGPAHDLGLFEERFSDYCQVDWCHAVNSGTSAIHLALVVAGIGPGDEVIAASMNVVAATVAILRNGAKPVFVDVDPVAWTMDPALIEVAITPRMRAIVPVHLHGLMADVDRIIPIARRHGLLVIEDAARDHRAEYKGFCAGAIGDLSCFNFDPDRNFGAHGEFGAVVTRHPDVAARVFS